MCDSKDGLKSYSHALFYYYKMAFFYSIAVQNELDIVKKGSFTGLMPELKQTKPLSILSRPIITCDQDTKMQAAMLEAETGLYPRKG